MQIIVLKYMEKALVDGLQTVDMTGFFEVL